MAGEKKFELGPIRPPNEAGSLLLRVSRNCPWNRCLFCPVYKNEKFSRRTMEEIKKDIDSISEIIDELKELSRQQGAGGIVDREMPGYAHRQRGHEFFMVAHWLYGGEKSVFLQDADNLIYPAEFLAEVISYLREKIPGCGRITTYARSKSITKKTTADLVMLKEAGLTRIHVGLESGSAAVLAYMKKGATPREHIEAGLKVKEAGLLLSEYIMPGLGGADGWQEHARETAAVLNAVNPHFIRLRTLAIHPLAPLMEEQQKGAFAPLDDLLVIREIKMMIENLKVDDCVLYSDHILNLLEDIKGRLPEDREKILEALDEFLKLTEEEQDLFRLGRRAGIYRTLQERNDPYLYGKVSTLYGELAKRGLTINEFIKDLTGRYL